MTKGRSDTLLTALVGLAFTLLYGFTVPTGLMGADNAEFATLAVSPGVAHPPGYPLYTLYLRAMAWIPATSPAHLAGLATALLGAAAVAVSFKACRAHGFGAGGSLLAASLVGLDLSVWSMHSHAEVFALNNLIAAGIIWAAAPKSPGGLSRAATLGLLAGLGLANHHSIVLLAPVGLWGMWRALREVDRRGVAVLLGFGTGLAGLSLYGYLIVSASDCIDCLQWGRLASFDELVDHILRADYGTTQLKPDGTYAPIEQWAAFGGALFRGTLGTVAIAALAGALASIDHRRGLLVALGATFVLSGLVFVGMFNIEPEGIGAQLVSRFYALPIIVLTPLVAAGVEAARRAFGRRALVAAAFALLVVGALNASTIVDEHHGIIDAYLHDTLTPLPENAIVFGTGDHRTFGAAYMQQTQELRRDVDWVDGRLLAYDWYVDRLETRLDRPLPRSRNQEIPIARFVGEALATGRPVFVANRFADIFEQLPTYPIGTVIRVLPPGERPPAPGELASRNAELFSRFRLDRPLDQVSNPWEREVYVHYRRPWDSLADVFERSGITEGARRARQMARPYTDASGAASDTASEADDDEGR